ncbi:MAG TPA: SWIM zinc finger family protein [Actinophytocola sp.]|uniref:SWIM zinc finger family protein n=1 Tax=Actinophytocola sp. TaxID=1872138 RepID=UPI002DDD2222|nr:SWIM zinc finger family protein [Actinophytocola sp.]HEV2783156.1 SWIM zinc finger family protein [Actinophytocola sp.]
MPDRPRTPFWDDPDYQKSGPIRVENGIRARTKRGAIGSTWWSRRFIDVLESLDLGGRLARARAYARSGQVVAMEVGAGAVSATVQGSRPEPYRVLIELTPIPPRQWRRIERALAGQVIFGAKLLAGEMPQDLEDVLDGLGLSLFPSSAADLTMTCSCPDWSVPCKHVAATLYLLAEAFDRDPFLILAWRGRGRAELLANLRRLRAPNSSTVDSTPRARRSPWDELGAVPEPPLAECVGSYLSNQGRLARLERHPAEIVVPDAVLRERDPLSLTVRGKPVTDLLRPAYLAMGSRKSG